MRNFKKSLLLYISVLFLLLVAIMCSCTPSPIVKESDSVDTLQYAKWLKIEQCEGYSLVTVVNPWQPALPLQRYVLVSRSVPVPASLPEATVVRTPIERAIMHNSVHAKVVYDLGAGAQVVGLCDVDYVMSDTLRAALRDTLLYDAGSSINFNMERCVSLHSDAVFVSPLQDVSLDPLRAVGIPVVACADYMEAHPLGRAEWIKFFGLLFDCRQRADSLFAHVEREYLSLVAQASQSEGRPRLMVDFPKGGTWYVPGGESYLGRLFADAGADYAFAQDTHSGSIALSRERGLMEARKADVWLIKQAMPVSPTYASLLREEALLSDFRPWKERRIYVCNTLHSDFFERIPFQPHVLLSELVNLFRQDSLEIADSAYYQPIQE